MQVTSANFQMSGTLGDGCDGDGGSGGGGGGSGRGSSSSRGNMNRSCRLIWCSSSLMMTITTMKTTTTFMVE